MKYYKDTDGKVFAYDAGQDVPPGLVEMTQEEIADHLSPPLTYAIELAEVNSAYIANRDTLCAAWLRAAVADGITEGERKADVEAELDEIDAKHEADVAELKVKYGVE